MDVLASPSVVAAYTDRAHLLEKARRSGELERALDLLHMADKMAARGNLLAGDSDDEILARHEHLLKDGLE
jgi:hypothetical protein